jgi:hypothetical protein
LLDEIIEKVNGLFEGELTDDDQLVYVNGVIKGKLLENDTLVQHAMSNSKVLRTGAPYTAYKAAASGPIDCLEWWRRPQDRGKSDDTGFDVHLVKPVSLEALLLALAGSELGYSC